MICMAEHDQRFLNTIYWEVSEMANSVWLPTSPGLPMTREYPPACFDYNLSHRDP